MLISPNLKVGPGSTPGTRAASSGVAPGSVAGRAADPAPAAPPPAASCSSGAATGTPDIEKENVHKLYGAMQWAVVGSAS